MIICTWNLKNKVFICSACISLLILGTSLAIKASKFCNLYAIQRHPQPHDIKGTKLNNAQSHVIRLTFSKTIVLTSCECFGHAPLYTNHSTIELKLATLDGLLNATSGRME